MSHLQCGAERRDSNDAVSPSYEGGKSFMIIITTGTFTSEARREASRDGVPPIELIDGEKLVDMLENLELGLKPVKAYEVDESFLQQCFYPITA
jgi:restriction endonuclease Mrr